MKRLLKKMRFSMSAKITLIAVLPTVFLAIFLLYQQYAHQGQLLFVNAEAMKSVINNFLVFILLVALIGTFFYFIFSFLVTKRIQAVSVAVAKFAAGDGKARADVVGTDEIGNLATSFNVLADEITIWRDNLEKTVADQVNEMLIMYAVTDTISQSLDLDKILPNVLEWVLESLGESKGAIVLVDREGETLKLRSQQGLTEETARQISLLKASNGSIGSVILTRKALWIHDGNIQKLRMMTGEGQTSIQSVLIAPISAQGVGVGATIIYSDKRDRFTEQDESILTSIGNTVGVAVENARLYEKTLELAQEDGLTGLANRRHLMNGLSTEVDRANRYGTPLSVLLLDIDKFKHFNDTYGHLKGDELLREFSALLKKAIRTTDIAGRYGGEEFVMVLSNTPLAGGITVAERIRTSMENLKISVDKETPSVGATVSIGVAEFAPGKNEKDLIGAADAALYRAKEGGRNRVVS